VGSDGQVQAWGSNSTGQLGDGSSTSVIRTTRAVVPGLSGIISVSGSNQHTLALENDGSVWAWGANMYGQLGDNSTTQRSTPVAVSGLTSGVIAVAAGTSH
ncbi:RCC1 domain-containing protein, partial [Paenibacillus sp. CGMCC 1.18879]|uniref:RCC1 domain-containing protein n=1 Tax=Paenibacillus sp. CGMCC 1.18879 TaxID=2834466 RepID=UPI001D7EFB5C|nr:RCC1 repeat- and reductase domain-containing protein [Paenibacillus sp. CGMCC 1.18879]